MSNKPKSIRKGEKSTVKARTDLPIYRNPTWSSNATFTINGMQLQHIINFSNMMKGIIDTSDEILKSGEVSGVVQTNFVYPDGTPVPESDPRLEELIAERDAEIEDLRNKIEEFQKRRQESIAKLQEQIKKAGGKTLEDLANEELGNSTEAKDESETTDETSEIEPHTEQSF